MKKAIKNIFLASFTIVLFVIILTLNIWAEDNKFAGGSGTENDPYLIETTEHLNNVRIYTDAHYKLIEDIVFSDEDFIENGAFYNNGLGWLPIDFSGVFDGNNHTIQALSITVTESPDKELSFGLFGNISYAKVCNIVMLNTSIFINNNHYTYVGCIAGNAYKSDISNCSVEGNITVKNTRMSCALYAGGIVGDASSGSVTFVKSKVNITTEGNDRIGGICGNFGNGSISSATNYGNLSGTSTMGGIVGETSTSTIEHCTNYGSLYSRLPLDRTSSSSTCGGIVGDALGKTYINLCSNHGNVLSDAVEDGWSTAAGIVAFADSTTSDETSKISKCYNSGEISAQGASVSNAGGITGCGYFFPIYDCYNSGKIVSISNAGGIIGFSQGVTVTTCYNTGDIVATYPGGIVGAELDSCFTYCIYMDNVPNACGKGTLEMTICTTLEMQNESTFTDWDFDNTWGFEEDNTYLFPTLIYNPTSVDTCGIKGHKWCEWTTTIGSTRTTDGEECRYCSTCLTYESRIIPKTGIAYPVIGGNVYFDSSTGEIYDCDETMYRINIPSEINAISVTSIAPYAFYNCYSLTSVTIPDSVTSIGINAFLMCDSLTSVTIGNGVTSIGDGAFFSCKKLESVTLGNSVTSIGVGAFSYCENLTSINIPDNVTNIDQQAFEHCISLETITMPDSITSITDNLFDYCRNLKSIKIGNSVTDIGNYAFKDCTSLESIVIPKNVTSMGEYAFYGCNLLETIYYGGLKDEWNLVKFGVSAIPSNVEIIYNYPCSVYGHAWSEWIVSSEPDCTESGHKYRQCSICKIVETKDIPSLGHKWGEWFVFTTPGCGTNGSEKRICNYCDRYETKSIPATQNHTYGDWEITVEPTCIAEGSQTKNCIVCGSSITQSILAKGHKYSVSITAPTCNQSGYTTYTCFCGDSYVSDVTSTLDHTFGKWIITIEPDCVTEGEETRTCVNCDTYETQSVPATGNHTYGEWSITKVANCTELGENIRYCVNCDATEKAVTETNEDHTWSSWTTSTNPTCMLEGSVIRICEKCGDYESKLIPATGNHIFDKWIVTIEPTAISMGEKTRQCVNCDATETEEIEKLEMTNPFTDVKDGQWYTEGILWCYHSSYMAGVSDTVFGRKDNVTRAMFATILAKIDGSDISGYSKMSFTDVKPGQWYSNAIEWAASNGYAAGLGEGIFGYKQNVSREQIALFFYTYSSKNGIDVSAKANLSAYTDLDRVHSWALDAVQWAVAKGLISGTSETTLSPRDSAARAEIALVIKNYVENVK